MQLSSFMESINNIENYLNNEKLNPEYKAYLEALLKVLCAAEEVNYTFEKMFINKTH